MPNVFLKARGSGVAAPEQIRLVALAVAEWGAVQDCSLPALVILPEGVQGSSR